jgi:hypothetical protein
MRQVISTVVVAVIVGALAGATMSAVARAPAEQAITPAAGINAATVDGKSAVGFTNRKAARKGKLVATNRRGELPSNIVRPFWGYIKNKPGILADGQVAWSEIVGKPATPTITLLTVQEPFSHGIGLNSATATCPAGYKVTGGGYFDVDGYAAPPSYLVDSYPNTASSWRVTIDVNGASDTATIYAICMTTENVTLAGRLTPAAKNPVRDR